MKSGLWMFCVIFFMFLVAPVFIVLIFLGPIGASSESVFMFWFPVVLCAASVVALIFYRQGVQRKQV